MLTHSDLGNFSRLNVKVITQVYPSEGKKKYIYTYLRMIYASSFREVIAMFWAGFLALKMGGDHGPVTFMFGPQSRLA